MEKQLEIQEDNNNINLLQTSVEKSSVNVDSLGCRGTSIEVKDIEKIIKRFRNK